MFLGAGALAGRGPAVMKCHGSTDSVSTPCTDLAVAAAAAAGGRRSSGGNDRFAR